MENKEFISEEKYQKAKKKITKISFMILIIGLVIGIGLIIFGIITKNNAEKTNDERYNAAYSESQAKVDEANKRLSEITTEIENQEANLNNMEIEISNMKKELSKIFQEDHGFSDRYYDKENEITVKETELSKLRMQKINLTKEKFELENADYTVYYTPILSIKYKKFYYIGAFVIIWSCLGAGIFYLIAKRREIHAFALQQTMPLTQEAIEKFSPTIGNLGKNIAKGITSGIKEGKENK